MGAFLILLSCVIFVWAVVLKYTDHTFTVLPGPFVTWIVSVVLFMIGWMLFTGFWQGFWQGFSQSGEMGQAWSELLDSLGL